MKNLITKNDVRELVESKKQLPLMVRWLDTDEIEIVAGVGFHDNSGWSEKKTPAQFNRQSRQSFRYLSNPAK